MARLSEVKKRSLVRGGVVEAVTEVLEIELRTLPKRIINTRNKQRSNCGEESEGPGQLQSCLQEELLYQDDDNAHEADDEAETFSKSTLKVKITEIFSSGVYFSSEQ
jgi:hypothetical protein